MTRIIARKNKDLAVKWNNKTYFIKKNTFKRNLADKCDVWKTFLPFSFRRPTHKLVYNYELISDQLISDVRVTAVILRLPRLKRFETMPVVTYSFRDIKTRTRDARTMIFARLCRAQVDGAENHFRTIITENPETLGYIVRVLENLSVRAQDKRRPLKVPGRRVRNIRVCGCTVEPAVVRGFN